MTQFADSRLHWRVFEDLDDDGRTHVVEWGVRAGGMTIVVAPSYEGRPSELGAVMDQRGESAVQIGFRRSWKPLSVDWVERDTGGWLLAPSLTVLGRMRALLAWLDAEGRPWTLFGGLAPEPETATRKRLARVLPDGALARGDLPGELEGLLGAEGERLVAAGADGSLLAACEAAVELPRRPAPVDDVPRKWWETQGRATGPDRS